MVSQIEDMELDDFRRCTYLSVPYRDRVAGIDIFVQGIGALRGVLVDEEGKPILDAAGCDLYSAPWPRHKRWPLLGEVFEYLMRIARVCR